MEDAKKMINNNDRNQGKKKKVNGWALTRWIELWCCGKVYSPIDLWFPLTPALERVQKRH